jgi:nucleotide-binding universal stress UspA family protein
MYQNILVPLDGSPFAEIALPHALEMARKFDSKICLVRVVPPPNIVTENLVDGTGELIINVQDVWRQEAEAYLQAQAGSVRQQGFEVKTDVRLNPDVAGAIIDAAQAYQAEVIVMSTHGRSGLGRWLFGSVAQKVLQHAPVHTLLIRAKDAKEGL